MKRYFFLTLIAVFTFAACSTSTPDQLLDEETYINLFIELAVLDQYDPLLLEQKQKEQLQEQILESYGVTFKEFRDSHDYYEKSLQVQIRRTEIGIAQDCTTDQCTLRYPSSVYYLYNINISF